MTEEQLRAIKEDLKKELTANLEKKVNVVGFLVGLFGFFLAVLGGFLAFEAFTLGKTLEVKEALIIETAERIDFHRQTSKLSRQVERVFIDLKAANSFEDLEERLEQFTTIIDTIDPPD